MNGANKGASRMITAKNKSVLSQTMYNIFYAMPEMQKEILHNADRVRKWARYCTGKEINLDEATLVLVTTLEWLERRQTATYGEYTQLWEDLCTRLDTYISK